MFMGLRTQFLTFLSDLQRVVDFSWRDVHRFPWFSENCVLITFVCGVNLSPSYFLQHLIVLSKPREG